jgi:hypothetical protein
LNMTHKEIVEQEIPGWTTDDIQESGSDAILIRIYRITNPVIRKSVIIKENHIIGYRG